MKNLTIALALILTSISWFAEASCKPAGIENTKVGKLESIGLLEFHNQFSKFRIENLTGTSLCSDEITFAAFEHDVDFVRMKGSTIYIESQTLAKIGSVAVSHSPSKEEIEEVKLTIKALMGVMTFFSYTNENWIQWYAAEAKAAAGSTNALGEFNRQKTNLMAKEKPLLALGLGIYRAITFERIPKDKRAYKQETHATPYQIAKALTDNEQLGMARELLILAQSNNYKLMDESKNPEMTLEMLKEIESLRQLK